MLVYVDDIITTGTSPHLIQTLISKLNNEFALKDLGDLHYLLGIEVHRLVDVSLLLSQQKYIEDLLQRSKMDKAKGIAAPMVSGLNVSKHGSDPMTYRSLYRLIMGALQYAIVTKPNRQSTSRAHVYLGQSLVSYGLKSNLQRCILALKLSIEVWLIQ